ncbi:MAG: hypothetical protein HYU66_08655 [Armatimonadetes bacterium]|nr:hypothetical protein [Armatimonadota bacterium]
MPYVLWRQIEYSGEWGIPVSLARPGEYTLTFEPRNCLDSCRAEIVLQPAQSTSEVNRIVAEMVGGGGRTECIAARVLGRSGTQVLSTSPTDYALDLGSFHTSLYRRYTLALHVDRAVPLPDGVSAELHVETDADFDERGMTGETLLALPLVVALLVAGVVCLRRASARLRGKRRVAW